MNTVFQNIIIMGSNYSAVNAKGPHMCRTNVSLLTAVMKTIQLTQMTSVAGQSVIVHVLYLTRSLELQDMQLQFCVQTVRHEYNQNEITFDACPNGLLLRFKF
jgi:hypothetical protein